MSGEDCKKNNQESRRINRRPLMLVTAAPYAIKGAAFDCFRDTFFFENRIYREEGRTDREIRRFPSARVRRLSAPDLGDRPFASGRLSVPHSLYYSALHRRL